MPRQLNVGIAGCGEAAQILHLPALDYLADHYRVTALCDASPAVLDGVGARLPWARRTNSIAELVDNDDVDVILVANPNLFHADTALAAIAAGKHVLIEKPICVTDGEAEAIEMAANASNVVVMVGYMRRYAPAFERAVSEIGDIAPINFANVHTIIGPNPGFIEPSSRVVRGTDIPEAEVKKAETASNAKLAEALGTDDPTAAATYSLLLGLSSHDTSAMRELLGMPKAVLSAHRGINPTFLTVHFDYGGFVCQFETGIDQIARFDSKISVYGQERVIEVSFDTPYIRNQATTFSMTSAKGSYGVYRVNEHDTLEDNFVREWRRFHDHVVNGSKPKSSVADARLDMQLFRQIMDALA